MLGTEAFGASSTGVNVWFCVPQLCSHTLKSLNFLVCKIMCLKYHIPQRVVERVECDKAQGRAAHHRNISEAGFELQLYPLYTV